MFYIAIVDYEMGNLKSIYKCLQHINAPVKITDNPQTILNADGVILPGVGAFGDAMAHLKQKDLIGTIQQIAMEQIPLFGICLGLQLLFSKSYEMGEHEGLDLFKGEIVKFDETKVDKIPQIGWNNVEFQDTHHYLVQNIPNNSYFYFVHSFYCNPANPDNVLGKTRYGEIEFCSMVYDRSSNIIASQFHPEKSSRYGIQIYRNFITHCKK
ncbi:MAG: Imidazole glycerol phosphate synthase subunit HisH [Promethearchaeota archaeon]|nr:MAG: Imidazole glycerol phosphate synthase subunit HisH [Candidatus Lokiarchaeota archaeon]